MNNTIIPLSKLYSSWRYLNGFVGFVLAVWSSVLNLIYYLADHCTKMLYVSPQQANHFIPTYQPSYLTTFIPTYLHTYLPSYLPTFIPTYLHTYLQEVGQIFKPCTLQRVGPTNDDGDGCSSSSLNPSKTKWSFNECIFSSKETKISEQKMCLPSNACTRN